MHQNIQLIHIKVCQPKNLSSISAALVPQFVGFSCHLWWIPYYFYQLFEALAEAAYLYVFIFWLKEVLREYLETVRDRWIETIFLQKFFGYCCWFIYPNT